MSIDKKNHEGYADPTTYEALNNIHHDEVAADKKSSYKPLVYVCSPYAGDVRRNTINARKYSRYVNGEGCNTSYAASNVSTVYG